MNVPHVYTWAKKRGFWGRRGEISHLLLDKGVLCIPETANDEFIHEYSKGVLQRGRAPCIVEYKTKTFRMFYDLDILTTLENAERMTAGDFSKEARVFHAICEQTAALFDVSQTTVTMCVSNAHKKKDEFFKVGIHLTFDSIFVTSPVALHVREKLLEKVATMENPFSNSWESILDVTVFKGSGMRLPWSAKQDDLERVYVPISEYVLDRNKTCVVENKLDVTKSLVSIKNVMTKVSLRTVGNQLPTTLKHPFMPSEVSDTTTSFSHSTLQQYSQSVEDIEKCIPKMYQGKITGVVKAEFAYMFRHSSRFCANVGREHTSSNTYFLVTKAGMRQCCYSRKNEDTGRKYCACSDFSGDLIHVPKHVLETLFPNSDAGSPRETHAMPCDAVREYLDIDNILERAHKKIKPKKTKQPRPKTYHSGKAVLDVFATR